MTGPASMSQMWSREKYFRNSLVAKGATLRTIMGRPLRLWVAFGDRATVFGQLWNDDQCPYYALEKLVHKNHPIQINDWKDLNPVTSPKLKKV